MPKYSYETYSDMKSDTTTQQKNNERKVGYFKLKPGEKAVVRFAYGSATELEITTVHEVKVKDKFRTIVCLRTAKEPLDACPLCANGTPLKARAYVKLLHYILDETGKVTQVSPEVANFPKRYADVLMSRYNEYGDLRDSLFTITRIGTGMDTSYDIQYANPVKYSEANGFVKDFSAFEDFDLAHHSYAERSKEDIEEFLQSGEFPLPKKATTGVGTAEVQDVDRVSYSPRQDTTNINPAPVKTVTAPVPSDDELPVSPAKPTQSSDDFMQRPRRTYDIQ